jgi:hypothetical protein
VIGECIVIELVVTAGIVLVEKYLKAVVIPVLDERVAVRVD